MVNATRRFVSVVRTTAVELIGEPFVFLMLLASLALTVLAPTFHFHQFGEVARLPRDAGFSAILLGGSLTAVFASIRSVRREVESGTCEAALAHAISPGLFLTAKIVGFSVIIGLFLTAVFSVMLVMVDGTEIGGTIAAREGGLARPWGPDLAIGVAALVLPSVLAAFLNRFTGWRFTPTATLFTWIFALVGAVVRFRADLVLRALPVLVLEAVPIFLLTGVASILAFGHRANLAAAGTGLVAAAVLPALGNYCLAEALANGGRPPASYVLLAFAAALPVVCALIALGELELARREDRR